MSRREELTVSRSTMSRQEPSAAALAFAHPIEDFVAVIARGTASSPSFRDGLEVQRVLGAVERSAATSSRWTRVNTLKDATPAYATS
jgi:predicted dehydrogenase